MTTKLTAADVSNCTWTFDRDEDGYRISIGRGTHPVSGVEITVERREPLFADRMIALNTEERNSRDGKRWGVGAGSEKGGNVPMIRVARTPINRFMADAARHLQQGDRDILPWLLNSDGYLPFRTKTGKL